jgi:hypothetical protein
MAVKATWLTFILAFTLCKALEVSASRAVFMLRKRAFYRIIW